MNVHTHTFVATYLTGDPFAEIQSFVRASSGCIMDRQEDSTFAGFAEKVPEYLPIDSFDMLIDRQFSFWTDEDELRIRNREIFIYYFSDYLVRHWDVCLSCAPFTTIPLFLCNPPTLASVKYYWVLESPRNATGTGDDVLYLWVKSQVLLFYYWQCVWLVWNVEDRQLTGWLNAKRREWVERV